MSDTFCTALLDVLLGHALLAVEVEDAQRHALVLDESGQGLAVLGGDPLGLVARLIGFEVEDRFRPGSPASDPRQLP